MKATKKEANRNRNEVLFFSICHFIVWLIMCSLFSWWGLLLGFLANIGMDSGVLLLWINQEKKVPLPSQLSLRRNAT
jgi:hypothetical protein